MSVDTYLRRKNVGRYQRLQYDDIELLIAPSLRQQAASLTLAIRRTVFLQRAFSVEAIPRAGHFHGPGCAH